MERPEHIPEAVWEKHLEWLNVTGETSRRHIRELHNGELARRYYGEDASPQERGRRASDADQPVAD